MDILQQMRDWIWGPWLIVIIMGTGLFLTLRLKGMQFRYLFYALKQIAARQQVSSKGDLSPFQALMTALAATIGIGNIAGVATALAIGGVGSLFWMVVAAFIGMATSYAESFMAVRFRKSGSVKGMAGGPMYYLSQGTRWRWLGWVFAVAGAIAAFATGNMVQANSITDVILEVAFIERWILGVSLALAVGAVLLGGVKSIGRVVGLLVPFMALFYIVGGMAIIILRIEQLPFAIEQIISSAFTGQAAIGGFLGSTFLMALQMGVSRGLFASEAGLGSSCIAAAAARVDVPGRQALINMTGAFLSVCLVCTITGLVITITGVLGSENAQGKLLNGVPLTIAAFHSVLPWGKLIVIVGAILFGYSTILGWAYYGEKCCEFLLGKRSTIVYRCLFTLFVILGAILELRVVWNIADIANALMAIPNLIGLLLLSPLLVKESKEFLAQIDMERLPHPQPSA